MHYHNKLSPFKLFAPNILPHPNTRLLSHLTLSYCIVLPSILHSHPSYPVLPLPTPSLPSLTHPTPSYFLYTYVASIRTMTRENLTVNIYRNLSEIRFVAAGRMDIARLVHFGILALMPDQLSHLPIMFDRKLGSQLLGKCHQHTGGD